MTYTQQSKMLAQLVKNSLKKTKLGVVIADTPSFADARASFIAAAKGIGLQVVYDRPYPKNASQSDALQTANALRAAGAEAVYVLTSPTSFIYLAQAANGQAYNPLYVGPGITSGLNEVASFGCPGVGNARFLSPFPQLDRIGQMDPNYAAAYRKFGGGNAPDDIGIALWALNKTIHTAFQAAGKDMSRQSLIATLESGKEFASGVFPAVKYAPGRHFGASTAHLLQADCGARQYKTLATFASGF
jgi:ABC-type branched-subunit amino acid transport system substrate-binding protein